jgi:hypothetical protein
MFMCYRIFAEHLLWVFYCPELSRLPENFPTGLFLREADKCFGICITFYGLNITHCCREPERL